jgi:predicted PurR-regulated permease PerM
MPQPHSSQPSSKSWQAISNSSLLRFLLLFGCSWATVLLINYFYSTIALFTAAGIFAALLNYPVVWLSRYIPRGLAITVTFVGALTLLLGLVMLIGLEVLNQGQSLLTQLRNTMNQPNLLPFLDSLKQLDIRQVIETLQTSLASGLGVVKSIFSSVFIGVFGAVISLYMLIDGEKLWQLSLRLLPVTYRDRFAKAFQQSFLGFLRGQLLLMLFLSGTTLLVFPFLGVNYALFLAIVLGVIDAIPGIGATLGITLVTFLVLASQGSAIAIKVLITCLILGQIQDNVVMGNALELNPVLLFLSLFIGERVAGLLGVFLAIPIAGTIAAWMRSAKAESQTVLEADPEIE